MGSAESAELAQRHVDLKPGQKFGYRRESHFYRMYTNARIEDLRAAAAQIGVVAANVSEALVAGFRPGEGSGRSRGLAQRLSTRPSGAPQAAPVPRMNPDQLGEGKSTAHPPLTAILRAAKATVGARTVSPAMAAAAAIS